MNGWPVPPPRNMIGQPPLPNWLDRNYRGRILDRMRELESKRVNGAITVLERAELLNLQFRQGQLRSKLTELKKRKG